LEKNEEMTCFRFLLKFMLGLIIYG
jgi:hypothetical protein